jgi:hypothetical protein
MASCRLIHSPITNKEETSLLWNQLFERTKDETKADEQYKEIYSEGFTQRYGNWVEGKSKISINKIGEPALRYVQDYLSSLQPKEFTESENRLFNSFDERIKQYGIEKIEKEATDDESESTSFYIKKEGDKEVPVRRVTEVAKAKNKARNGGVDYFANATPEQKEQWKRKAMSGTEGHALLEAVTNAALNLDGTVKNKSDIDITGIKTDLHPTIARLLTEYLLGNDEQIGLLYSFPAGTRFKTEQIIYSPKDNLAGTTDLTAFLPDGKVEVLDYKFMGFDLEKNLDIPVQKRQQHAIQLGEYKKILTTYGIRPSNISARTIPIHAQYVNKQVEENGKNKWLPHLQGITLGKLNMQDEDRTYLLSVTPDDQSTGNDRVDDLVKSLKSWYKKLYNRKADDHGRELKIEELNTLSTAIRNLQIAINFDPLAEQAAQYTRTAQKIIDDAKVDLDSISPEEKDKILQDLISAFNISEQYAGIDRIFKSAYGEEEELTEKQRVTLSKLNKVSDEATAKRDRILEAIKRIIIHEAEKEGIQGLDKAEIEINEYIKNTRELGSQQPKAIQLFSTIYSRGVSKSKIKYAHEAEEYGKIYDEAEKSVGGKNPFDFIAIKDGHELIPETSKDLWKGLEKAKENKDKKWVKENIHLDQYAALYEHHLSLYKSDIERTSDNQEENNRRLSNWKKKFDINDPDFFGYDNFIIKKTLKKELWETTEFKKIKENKSLYELWKFWNELNKRSFSSGFLDHRHNTRFLPFILGTTLERTLGGDVNSLKALKGSIADRFSTAADEDMKYSAIDEETGEQKKSIPKFYTQDLSVEIKDKEGKVIKRDYSNLSKDLRLMGLKYLYALNRYEAMDAIENEVEAIKLVEQSKGHLELQNGKVVMVNDHTPRVFKGNEKNIDVLQDYIDDGLYGIHYDRDSIGDKLLNTLNIGEDKKLSAMKAIQQSHKLVHLQALALKTLVMIPNTVGGTMQSLINAGRYFTKKEFTKSLFETVGSVFPHGKEGEIEKGLIDYLVPINDDFVKRSARKTTRNTFEKVKYWSMADVLMSTLSVPDKVLQIANARAFIKNTMVTDGKLINIREYLKNQPEYRGKYQSGRIREIEKEFERKVKELQETSSLKKIAFINENGYLEIPGIEYNSDTVADVRNKIIQISKNALGFMPEESRRLYTRDIIKNSFAMFKHWMLPHTEQRFAGLKYSKTQDIWVYGRMRLAAKIISKRWLRSASTIRNIITANPEGLKFLNELWEQKKEDYFRKTGVELSEEMSEEQFYDLIRSTLKQEVTELKMLAGLMSLLLWAKAATPPDDEEDKNKFKLLAKAISKSSDELLFYYDPTSAQSITRGSILPSLSILSQAKRIMTHSSRLIVGNVTGDEDMIEKAHLTKAIISTLPVGTFFETEVLPIINPEMAKELGIKVTDQARPGQ